MATIPKVLLIGLDGADPDFIKEHRSKLPFLNRLMQEGTSGRLASTIPPITGPAWSSAMSGMNPGRTGVVGFQDDPGDRKSRLVHSQSVAVPRIWDVLSQHQRRVGVVAVPMTYPPQPVNGFMISDFLTPLSARRFTYPESLRAEISPDYRTGLDFNKNEAPLEYFLQRLYFFSRIQFQTIEQLIKDRDWDFFTFVVSQTDWIQHIFFDQPDGSNVILRYFQYVDRYLDKLEKKLPPGTIVSVISDHGFGKKTFFHLYPNTWLQQEGYLTVKNQPRDTLRSLAGANLRVLGRIPGAGALKRRLTPGIKKKLLATTFLRSEQVDWEKTRAHYSAGDYNTGFIRINRTRDREEDHRRLAEEIVDRLNELNRSEGANPPFRNVYLREEVYQGPLASRFPEIVIIFSDKFAGQEVVGRKVIGKIPISVIPGPAHRMEGIFIIRGPDIKAGLHRNADICDVAPTLYHLMGVPLPEGTDGEVLKDILLPESQPALTDVKYLAYKHIVDSGFRLKEEEEENVRERLRALGYLV